MTTIDREFFDKYFWYEPEIINRLVWKSPPKYSTPKPGDLVGNLSGTGYIEFQVEGRKFLMHRVIWFLNKGYWPKGNIDHINGDGLDNRISNLRDVPQSENTKNQGLQKRNTSGYPGVHWYSPRGKWVVKIGVKGKSKHIGYFKDKGDAINARKEAEKLYNYHPNHGRS